MARANEGDTIRLYGYSGTFVVVGVYSKPLGEFVGVTRSRNGGRELFQQHESSIVEVNGEPKPLQSCPIAPPALDYPHVPQFEYNDGPAHIAEELVKEWHLNRAEVASQ